jgi:surfactin synthase thioesterase subunit
MKITLFCLHFAGGNRFSLRDLKSHIHPNIDFVTLETPGRGARISEPLLYDLKAMAHDLYLQIKKQITGPYLLYGHSMGSMLGFLVLRLLQENRQPMPEHFFATGCLAPSRNDERKMRHLLPDEELKKELFELGGFPTEILAHQELLSFFIPIIKADFQAVETYRYTPAPPHQVPITALKGSEETITEEQLQDWQIETQAKLTTYTLPGNHFFIFDHLPFICQLINRKAGQLLIG